MANEVVVDIIEGVRWREEDGVLVEIVRTAIVYNITGIPAQTTLDGIVKIALANPLVPQPGTVHPHYPGLFLRERNAHALSGDMIQIECVYRSFSFVQPPSGEGSTLSGGAVLDIEETSEDINGNQVILSHNDKPQSGKMLVKRPRNVLFFGRVETTSQPGIIARQYGGTVNAAGWTRAPDPARMWLCTGVQFTLITGTTPTKYQMDYSFEFNAKKHDPKIEYTDPETGEPPPGLVDGTGRKVVLQFQEAQFNALGL